MGEVLSVNGKNQIRIAETEKYPHVTFFFNGGKEEKFINEKRIMCESPKVALPSTWRFPSTSALSVICTLPALESRTRLPAVVEISLLAATPMVMSSAVISVEVMAWLN